MESSSFFVLWVSFLITFAVYAGFFFLAFLVFLILTLLSRSKTAAEQSAAAQKKYKDYRRAALICFTATVLFVLAAAGTILYALHMTKTVLT